MKIAILLLSLLYSVGSFAQTDFEGKITYSFELINLPAEMEAMKSMFPKESTVEISNGNSRTVINTGKTGKKVILNNLATGKTIILMDVMGQKIATETNKSEKLAEAGELKKTDSTKNILGYSCAKAIVSSEGLEIVIFYTNELPSVLVGDQSYGIDGFPMEIQLRQEAFTLVQTVTNIQEESIPAIELVVPEGYQLMSLEKIQKALQGGM